VACERAEFEVAVLLVEVIQGVDAVDVDDGVGAGEPEP
jgi:hypothetical protein